MRHGVLFFLGSVALAIEAAAQTAVDVTRPEERQKAQQAVVKEQEKRAKHASIIEFRGGQAFKEKELRTALKEEITTIEDFGLSPARGDDLAFFLEVFFRKHGYADVNVHYTIESENRLRLDITEGPRYRSEEHTSELQSQSNLVCRLLLEKKKNNKYRQNQKMLKHDDIPVARRN